jgi:hypothetical protein
LPVSRFEEVVVGVPKRTRDAILASLPTTPDDLGRLLKDRDNEDLLRPSRDGGWGVVEILAHLRDWEEVFLERLKTVGVEDNPFLPVQDDELWPIERDYRGQNPENALEQFRGRRAGSIALLQGLDAGEWERPARHGSFGDVTLHWLADHMCDHDQEHLDQARDALA